MKISNGKSRFNQWVIDDNQRSSYCGNGLELTTDAWSAQRAKRGIFVPTTPRNPATSTQLDTGC